MKSRDVIIGFIFLVVLIAGALLIFRNRNKKVDLPTPTPTISEKVNQAFPNLNVPDGADRADLNSVSNAEGVGVATKQKTNDTYTVTVMANLPDPKDGSYSAEILNGNEKITLGNLVNSKSGFMVNFTTTQDISAYKKVTVSLNGTSVLEGSF